MDKKEIEVNYIVASFIKEIKNVYKVNTYQGTKNTYDWIIKAIHKGDFQKLKIETKFLFDISDITCSCQGIEEFVENAYGQGNYGLISMNMSVYSEDKSTAYIMVNSFNGVKISADSKVMLERIVSLLESTSLDETEVNDPISVMYIDTQINNDGVIIQGNSNVVANNHSQVEMDKTKDESRFKKFWSGVWQNITSNFIWYLLTLAAGGLLTYILTN